MIKTHERETYLIEKVLRSRGKGNKTDYLVRWKGWAPKCDSWISEKGMKALNMEGTGPATSLNIRIELKNGSKASTFVGTLGGMTDAQRSAILKSLTKPQLRAVLEAIYNVLRGNCSVNERDRNNWFATGASFADWFLNNLPRYNNVGY